MPRRLNHRTFASIAAAGLTLGLSACSTVVPGVASTSNVGRSNVGQYGGAQPTAPRPGVATLTGPGELAHSSLPPSLQRIDPRRGQMPLGYAAPRPDLYPQSQSYIQQVAHFAPQEGQMSVGEFCPPPVDGSLSCPPHVYQAVPRVELPVIHGVESAATSSELFPDEYICDGGDEGLKTRVEQDGTVVLQFEETVATYLDEEATAHVEPSSRVCIYAPSFGAVRTISQQVVDLSIDKVAGAHDSLAASGYIAPLGPVTGEKTDTGLQTRVRSRLSEFDVQRADANVLGVTSVQKHNRTLNVFQEYSFLADQTLDGSTIAILREGVDAAIAWQGTDAPVIVGKDESLLQMRGRVMAEEYFIIEDGREDADLRLIKTADVKAALPGDEVKFAIRFDNRGGKPVFGVTVVDHLSPRLELVEGSVECDRLHEVVVEDDLEGSAYLKVKLSEALEAGESGVVTFTCRVR